MSLAGKSEVEVEIQSSAEKFYHMFRSRAHNIPNICPEKVPAIDMHQGEWDKEGSVKLWNYVLDENVESVKETVEAIDDENKTISFNVLEGDVMQNYKSFKSTLRVVEKGEGALVKWTADYEKANENVSAPDKYMSLAVAITKDIDAHLLKA